MKNIFIILCLSLAFISCNEEQEEKGYAISGTVENVPDGTNVFVIKLDENNQPVQVDTLQVKEGKFEADLPEVEQPDLAFLSVEGFPGNVVYLAENEEIKFKVYKDSLRASEVTGGPENKLFHDYIEHLRATGKKAMASRDEMTAAFATKDSVTFEKLRKEQEEITENAKLEKIKIVKENPDRLIAAIVVTDLMNQKLATAAELKELYSGISEEIKNTPIGKDLGEALGKMEAVSIGSKAPNFSAPTPTGEELSLEEAMGKITIVDFWASWCKPCRIENPNVVKIYNKYHDQGLNIIGVSLDKASQKDKWLEAIQEDNLTWSHVSNLQYWQEPIAQTYGVRSIPATFILDENGTIVAKDLRGDELEAKIAELLAEAPAN